MKTIDQKTWDAWKADNADSSYAKEIFRFAEAWADLMEGALDRGLPMNAFYACAEECSRQADVNNITGFMYGTAVGVLTRCWVHGAQLAAWHESDGATRGLRPVVNLAAITLRD